MFFLDNESKEQGPFSRSEIRKWYYASQQDEPGVDMKVKLGEWQDYHFAGIVFRDSNPTRMFETKPEEPEKLTTELVLQGESAYTNQIIKDGETESNPDSLECFSFTSRVPDGRKKQDQEAQEHETQRGREPAKL